MQIPYQTQDAMPAGDSCRACGDSKFCRFLSFHIANTHAMKLLGVLGLSGVLAAAADWNQAPFAAENEMLFEVSAGSAIERAAARFGEPVKDASSAVKAIWAELQRWAPEQVDKALAYSYPRPYAKRADWDFVVRSADVPGRQLRVKTPTELGVDTVDQWSGYLDIDSEDKHFFFWAFESRNDPENDPVVLWLNGGPGCSPMTGLFFELGPAAINEKLEPVRNEFSWNNNATVIFLDQPVNVGYSYSSARVNSTRAAAPDVYAFLELFFHKFHKFAGNDFHIAGESYCGHYIPEFATEVLAHEDRSFNLTSVLIGNGITDPLIQNEAWEWMACGKGGYPAVISEDECQKLHAMYPTCRNLTQTCYDERTDLACVPANIYCDQLIEPYRATGRNFFDIRDQCGDSGNCYKQDGWIEDYMNLDHVKQALGIEVKNFTGCDSGVSHDFSLTGDRAKPYQGHVAKLLEHDIPVLIYAGDKDFRCNWLGNRAWVEALPWSGHDEYTEAATRPWKVAGTEAGTVRNAGPLTFLRIYDAGHMVPFNQPQHALAMLNEWMAGNLELA